MRSPSTVYCLKLLRRRNRRPLLRPQQLHQAIQLRVVQRVAERWHAFAAMPDLIFDLVGIHVLPHTQQAWSLLRSLARRSVAMLTTRIRENLRAIGFAVRVR